MRIRQLFGILLVGTVLAVSGCDVPTAPEMPAVENVDPDLGLLSGLTNLLQPTRTADVLKRTVPLERDLQVTRVIGRSGGTIRIPEAGLTVTIPRGALRGSTAITVRAPAGDLVGYHFAPHGLQFERAVTVRQDLSNTEASLLRQLLGGLSGGYFEGELQPRLRLLEILDLNLIDNLLAQFRIRHFSGYVIATD